MWRTVLIKPRCRSVSFSSSRPACDIRKRSRFPGPFSFAASAHSRGVRQSLCADRIATGKESRTIQVQVFSGPETGHAVSFRQSPCSRENSKALQRKDWISCMLAATRKRRRHNTEGQSLSCIKGGIDGLGWHVCMHVRHLQYHEWEQHRRIVKKVFVNSFETVKFFAGKCLTVWPKRRIKPFAPTNWPCPQGRRGRKFSRMAKKFLTRV